MQSVQVEVSGCPFYHAKWAHRGLHLCILHVEYAIWGINLLFCSKKGSFCGVFYGKLIHSAFRIVGFSVLMSSKRFLGMLICQDSE